MSYIGPRIRPTKSPQQYSYNSYPYQDWGTQLTWRDQPPVQTRGADARSLGDFYKGSFLSLPKAGAPEIVMDHTGYAGTDCVCKAGPTSVGDVFETISNLSTPVKIAGVVGVFLLYKSMKKRR